MLVRRVYVFKKDFKVSRLHGLRDLVGASALTTVSLLCPDPVLAEPATVSANDPYVFDDNMMFGNGSLSRFNRINAVEPGQYKVDLFINRRFVDRVDLRFASQGNGDVQPCLSEKLLESSGVLKSAIHTTDDNQCLILSQAIHGASTAFDFSILRLDLSIPQSLMINTPRGYVPTQSLDAGSLMGFVNYSANQYHVTRSGKNNSSTDSSYLSLNSGLNVGLWRLRHQGNWRYDNDYGSHWNTTRTYAQRALPGIKGDLTAGQGFTSGRFFSGLSYTGIEIASDDRMLPESQRGYAPTIRGVATSNAQVIVRQNGNDIYQTTVTPGPFEINDLYSTNYNGDLEVSVIEADGNVSTFTVPFSAVPESLRPGVSRYSLALGRTRDNGDHDPFGEVTYQIGLSNSITANSGLRIADRYQAFVVGGVYSSSLGAFGLDTTYSRADLPGDGQLDGWMGRLSYSRTFQPTNTTLSIAGYRYSTEGYRDLGDVLGVRRSTRKHETWESTSYMQRSRFEVSISQSLDDMGSVFLSGSTQDYRNGRDRDTQLQFGWSNTLRNNISLNLTTSRQTTGSYLNRRSGHYDDPLDNTFANGGLGIARTDGRSETVTLLSVSFPLGSPGRPNTPYLSTSVTHSSDSGNVYQTSLSGTQSDDQSLSYGIDASRDAQQKLNVFSASLQKYLPNASLSATASKSQDYWQASGSARGALALHEGGITFGPYLSDTFALIEAKGASGAKVMSASGATIDSRGYALVPSLTPYRYNSVVINPEGISEKTEIGNGQQRVAPYAGAAVKVKFNTVIGNAILVKALRSDGKAVPMGADVLDDSDSVIGMVGQGSQAYLRTDKLKGTLVARWGDAPEERCSMHFDLTRQDVSQALIKINSECRIP
ncbi:fimbria/pilus outer membrane usher protein [Pseudomonas helleri]|uniref:fimbria/pilus outer membrane usher protein n=1 Tax=Pseudomonas helleri TaxID=1608996 RepID=UPI0021CAB45C|nr:fimbria/pilus outer membrane usher protein [Pseudomonas helleri]MCU1756544.1 fimbrial biogenesis outer membrane usher protein [Pseudomonas helleri]